MKFAEFDFMQRLEERACSKTNYIYNFCAVKSFTGENDDGIIQSCTEAKDQAAIISILFFTRKIVEVYGAPKSYTKP